MLLPSRAHSCVTMQADARECFDVAWARDCLGCPETAARGPETAVRGPETAWTAPKLPAMGPRQPCVAPKQPGWPRDCLDALWDSRAWPLNSLGDSETAYIVPGQTCIMRAHGPLSTGYLPCSASLCARAPPPSCRQSPAQSQGYCAFLSMRSPALVASQSQALERRAHISIQALATASGLKHEPSVRGHRCSLTSGVRM